MHLLSFRWRTTSSLLLLVCLLASAGCRTLAYREVQRDFNHAVQVDLEQDGSPFIDFYGGVFETLTPAYIGGLNPKLRPNAWMLRGVAAWRSDRLGAALASADRGLDEPTLAPQSRDQIILRALPALVIDRDLEMRWRAGDKNVGSNHVEYARQFRTAWVLLQSAQNDVGPGTPAPVEAWLHYQKWRLLQNWAQIIAEIRPTPLQREANEAAALVLQKPLLDVAAGERDAVPASHPLRARIRQAGGS